MCSPIPNNPCVDLNADYSTFLKQTNNVFSSSLLETAEVLRNHVLVPEFSDDTGVFLRPTKKNIPLKKKAPSANKKASKRKPKVANTATVPTKKRRTVSSKRELSANGQRHIETEKKTLEMFEELTKEDFFTRNFINMFELFRVMSDAESSNSYKRATKLANSLIKEADLLQDDYMNYSSINGDKI